MNRAIGLGLMGAVTLISLGGCTPASMTPEQTVRKAWNCVATGNKDGFMGCITGSEQELRLAGASMDFICALKAFRNAFEATYGEERFRGLGEDHSFAGLSAGLEAVGKVEVVEAKREGNSSVCIASTEGFHLKFVHLTRKGGQWYVNPADVLNIPQPEGKIDTDKRKVDAGLSILSQLASMFRDKTAKIGTKGVTPETLKKEIDNEFMGILLTEIPIKASGKPK